MPSIASPMKAWISSASACFCGMPRVSQIKQQILVERAGGRAVAALHVVGEDLQLRLVVGFGVVRQQQRLRHHLGVGLLRARADDDLALEHAAALAVEHPIRRLEQQSLEPEFRGDFVFRDRHVCCPTQNRSTPHRERQTSEERYIFMAKAKLVTGLFKNKIAAEAAVDALLKRGYSRDEVSVLMSDATRSKEFALQTRSHAADGAGIGGAVGGAVGAVLAAIAAVGSTIFLPGINLVIAGPIAAALAGAGAGGATGGLIGGLIGAGIPEYRAKVYDAGLRGGGILLGVESRSDDDVGKIEELLEAVGAEHVRTE